MLDGNLRYCAPSAITCSMTVLFSWIPCLVIFFQVSYSNTNANVNANQSVTIIYSNILVTNIYSYIRSYRFVRFIFLLPTIDFYLYFPLLLFFIFIAHHWFLLPTIDVSFFNFYWPPLMSGFLIFICYRWCQAFLFLLATVDLRLADCPAMSVFIDRAHFLCLQSPMRKKVQHIFRK